MCDWTDADISRISETDFPVFCARCGGPLAGLGERGRCPACGATFSRRERLWALHGPEAFADPDLDDDSEQADDPDAVFVVFSVLLFVTLFPLIVLIGQSLFGTIDLCFTITAWLVVAISLEWIALRRFAESRAASGQTDGSDRDDGPGT